MARNEREATLGDLLIQMKLTNKLLAAALKQTMGQKELVRLLAPTGATAVELASMLDTTPATIATTLQRLKRVDAKPSAGESADG